MLKRFAFALIALQSFINAETAPAPTDVDQEFINITSNWNQFKDLISKPESTKGESEYEKTVRAKLLEIIAAPHKALVDSAAKDAPTRQQAMSNAQKMAPLINIWTEEWKRSIELRKIQSEIQVIGDNELNIELSKNLEHSINIRQSQLDLLKHNNNYLAINEKVRRRTQQISELQQKNQTQAQMIEHLKKQLAEAQKAASTTQTKTLKPTPLVPVKKKPTQNKAKK